MRSSKLSLMCLGLSITLLACSAPTPVKPVDLPITAQPTSSSETIKEIPYDYQAMQQDVLIQLNDEPRLHSPIITLVAPTTQTYTFFFRQPMDRISVEQSIQTQLEQAIAQDKDKKIIMPDFTFKWLSDHQLHVTVVVPTKQQPSYPEPYPEHYYLLHVDGAKTKAGKILNDTPAFRAIPASLNQLWRVSLDGSTKEPLTAFTQPYLWFEFIDEENRYLMLSRTTEYCRCDARYEKLYSLYDTQENQLISYPVTLTTDYFGEGKFVADTRGFFYAQPASKDAQLIPQSETAININLSETVYGASFSKDHQKLIMAIGSEQQEQDFDLIIYDLRTGKQKRLPKAVLGLAPKSESDGIPMPVTFRDDGVNVYFSMRKDNKNMEEIRSAYSWASSRVIPWKPPIDPQTWSGFTKSSDGKYVVYANGGLYKENLSINKDLYFTGHWIPRTHLLVAQQISPDALQEDIFRSDIMIYDADQNNYIKVASKFYTGTDVIGASLDGKWIYLKTLGDQAYWGKKVQK